MELAVEDWEAAVLLVPAHAAGQNLKRYRETFVPN
jgi:hypothetical protein